MLANNVDPDQMPHYVASDLGLYCLPLALFTGFQARMGQPFFDQITIKFYLYYANNADPVQTPQNLASDQVQHAQFAYRNLYAKYNSNENIY